MNYSGVRPDFKKRTFGNAAATAIAIAAGADMASLTRGIGFLMKNGWKLLEMDRLSKVKSNGNCGKNGLNQTQYITVYNIIYIYIWLVVWNMNFMTFHSVGKNDPN